MSPCLWTSLQICWNKGFFRSLLSAFSWALLQHGENLEWDTYILLALRALWSHTASCELPRVGWLVSRSTENAVGKRPTYQPHPNSTGRAAGAECPRLLMQWGQGCSQTLRCDSLVERKGPGDRLSLPACLTSGVTDLRGRINFRKGYSFDPESCSFADGVQGRRLWGADVGRVGVRRGNLWIWEFGGADPRQQAAIEDPSAPGHSAHRQACSCWLGVVAVEFLEVFPNLQKINSHLFILKLCWQDRGSYNPAIWLLKWELEEQRWGKKGLQSWCCWDWWRKLESVEMPLCLKVASLPHPTPHSDMVTPAVSWWFLPRSSVLHTKATASLWDCGHQHLILAPVPGGEPGLSVPVSQRVEVPRRNQAGRLPAFVSQKPHLPLGMLLWGGERAQSRLQRGLGLANLGASAGPGRG